jgi:hypothetical protein
VEASGSAQSAETEQKQTVREQAQTRLAELTRELEKGQMELQRIDRQQAYLRETLLRVSGAVQVLQELLADDRRGTVPERLAVEQERAGREQEGLTPVA